jgi:hypothetical protein
MMIFPSVQSIHRSSWFLSLSLMAAFAMPAPAAACVSEPFFSMHRDERSTAVLVRPAADSVYAGWGDVQYRRTEWQPRSLRNTPIYGQVVEVERAGGPGGAGLSPGRAVLVPWFYDPACATVPWESSAIWLPDGSREAVTGRLRRREDWVDGMPTIDVFSPELVRGSGMRPGSWPGNVETAETLFEYYAAVPSSDHLARDPWGAVAPLRAWIDANPESAARPPIVWAAASVMTAAASADVRMRPSELAGTYRMEMQRTGGPLLTFYARSALRPSFALRSADTAAVLAGQAAGYQLALALSADSADLPVPGGPVRRAYGGHGRDNGYVDIRLPASMAEDGTRRFEGYVLTLNFSGWFRRQDRELNDHWDTPMFRRFLDHNQQWFPAEIVVTPDGRVTITQRMELAPGRMLTIRGERIDTTAWECAKDEC